LTAGKFTKVDFARCISGARTLDPEELKPITAYRGAILHEFYPAPDTPRGLATPWSKVGDRLRFRPGEMTIWTGFSGHGKSLVLNHVVAAGLQRGERFCVASMEMLPSRTSQRLIKQLTGLKEPTVGYIHHCLDLLAEKIWLFDLLGTAKVERMLEVFAYAVRRYQVGHFVVDSLAKCGLAEDDYNGQKALVERLVDFVHQHNVHVHLVSHSRKGVDERTPPGKMDVKGTGAITDLADNVITVWRNKPKEEQRARAEADGQIFEGENAEKPDAALMVSKQRHGGWEGEIWLWFDPDSQQYLAKCGDSSMVYIDYVGEQHDGD
jgi:twinkle protein